MSARIRVDRRPAAELSDDQIERLMDFGRREAQLIDEMTAAVAVGDRALTWQLAEALAKLQGEAREIPTT
jgi:hypothetical protein